MIELPIYNQAGDKVSSIQVDEDKLGGAELNHSLLKQAMVMYHANQRQGTVQTQARGEVAGSTRKLFKQKGTGNARTGGIRNPIKVGGGHAKQKRPKDWRQAMPKKARRLARNQALLAKIQSSEVVVLDAMSFDSIKTKTVATLFKKLGLDRTVLLAVDGVGGANANLEKSARNIDRTTLTTVAQLNAWDILRTRKLVVTKAGLEQLLA
jgi:large subunit ribosomal protein L4